MIEVRAYATEDGKSPYRKWFRGLHAAAAIKITSALERMEDGNFSNVKAVGSGVSECKIDFGPGYRIYFGMDGKTLVILLCGGSKKAQSETSGPRTDSGRITKHARKPEPAIQGRTSHATNHRFPGDDP